jgi:hypothetical protein
LFVLNGTALEGWTALAAEAAGPDGSEGSDAGVGVAVDDGQVGVVAGVEASFAVA